MFFPDKTRLFGRAEPTDWLQARETLKLADSATGMTSWCLVVASRAYHYRPLASLYGVLHSRSWPPLATVSRGGTSEI